MNIFRRPDYKSDATQFLEQLKQANPTLADRATHWIGPVVEQTG
jgi:hypothetical protein